MKRLDSLRYTSIAAAMAVLYLTVIVVIRSGQNLNEAINVEDVSFAELTDDIFRAIPIARLKILLLASYPSPAYCILYAPFIPLRTTLVGRLAPLPPPPPPSISQFKVLALLCTPAARALTFSLHRCRHVVRPQVTLAYTFQFNLFEIRAELIRPKRKRVTQVVVSALTICFVIYMLVAIFGYLTFFSKVQGNILINYEPDDPYILVGRLGLALVIVFSFPLLALPCYNTVDNVLFPPEKWNFSYCRRGVILAVVGGVQFTVAVLVDDISVPLGIAGTCAVRP